MKVRRQWFPIFSYILSIPLLAALLSHAYIGFFTRYWYDDFATSVILRDMGFIGSQKYWYANWSGRFSFHITVNLAELIGPRLVPLLPSIALVVWLIVTTWAIYQIFLIARLPYRLASSLLLAKVIIFVTLNSMPDVVQSLYWQTGVLTYLAPIVLWTIYLGVFISALRRQGQGRTFGSLSIIAALIIFYAGGFSEVSSVVQIGGLSLLVLTCLLYVSHHFTCGSFINHSKPADSHLSFFYFGVRSG